MPLMPLLELRRRSEADVPEDKLPEKVTGDGGTEAISVPKSIVLQTPTNSKRNDIKRGKYTAI